MNCFNLEMGFIQKDGRTTILRTKNDFSKLVYISRRWYSDSSLCTGPSGYVLIDDEKKFNAAFVRTCYDCWLEEIDYLLLEAVYEIFDIVGRDTKGGK